MCKESGRNTKRDLRFRWVFHTLFYLVLGGKSFASTVDVDELEVPVAEALELHVSVVVRRILDIIKRTFTIDAESTARLTRLPTSMRNTPGQRIH